MRSVLGLTLAFACIAALPPFAQSAPARAAAFDPARIHADYQAGEFEKVIRALEAFRESGRRCRKADSVFLEKHLAVVYAADPKTRERGRYHMLRMLALEPESDLLDMFVGEEVDGIFEKVRKESRVRRMAQAKARAAQAPRASKGAAPRTTAIARSAAGQVPTPALPGPRPAVPAAGVSRPAFPEPDPAPRLKPWNLEDVPAPRRAPRKPGASRAAAVRDVDAGEEAYTLPPSESPSARSNPEAGGKPRRVAMPASALPAWDLDRTAFTGPAMGVLPPDGGTHPIHRVAANQAKPTSLDLPSTRLPHGETSVAANPEGTDSPAAGPKPRWKDRGFWVGGTAVAAVLGLTVYYVGSQEWSESASKSRTYGVAAKPNRN